MFNVSEVKWRAPGLLLQQQLLVIQAGWLTVCEHAAVRETLGRKYTFYIDIKGLRGHTSPQASIIPHLDTESTTDGGQARLNAS